MSSRAMQAVPPRLHSTRTGVHAARALRLELELGFAPIGGPQLWEIIRERRIDLAFAYFGEDGGDGLYMWNTERGLIVLNTACDVLRIRFTAAHELGHHQMHGHDAEVFADKDVEEVLADDREYEANVFAAEFLAPDAALRREAKAFSSPSIQPIDVVRLMQTYGVRYEFLLWRLNEINILDDANRARLKAQTERLPQFKALVGFDDAALAPPSQPLPADFVLNSIRLFQQEAISKERLAELLRTNLANALERAEGVPVEYPEPDPAIEALLKD
jgi:Zn-dependent peptidase ImmA (M78 family)